MACKFGIYSRYVLWFLSTFLANYHSILKNKIKTEKHGSLMIANILASGARLSGLIPAAGEETF